jgi:hypothetical protein
MVSLLGKQQSSDGQGPVGVLERRCRLYVGNLSDATVSVYSPPFSAGTVPSLTFKVSTGAFAIFGIAIGK